MFSNQLPDDENYRVIFSPYALRHFIKRFAKDYKGKRWDVTMVSIEQDLRRVYALQLTQQVDELKRGSGCLLFKYDFAVAQSGISPKASGNRCIAFLDISQHRLDVLLVYGKSDLPKNMNETQYICQTVQDNYKEMWDRLD